MRSGSEQLAVWASPLGPIRLAASERGLLRLDFDNEAIPEATAPNDPILATTIAQLQSYFAGDRTCFDIPLDLRGTPFQLGCWMALTAIPCGETITYRELAARVGRPTAIRAVGTANGANPISIVVPCHRVIGTDGTLRGYGGGLDRKKQLLALERQAPINVNGVTQ
jgi:methylated-DNA-[protein]-cysteine S-methyltransferase